MNMLIKRSFYFRPDFGKTIKSDTIQMNKKTIPYDLDIWYMEYFVQYLHKKHGGCQGMEGKTLVIYRTSMFPSTVVRYFDIFR